MPALCFNQITHIVNALLLKAKDFPRPPTLSVILFKSQKHLSSCKFELSHDHWVGEKKKKNHWKRNYIIRELGKKFHARVRKAKSSVITDGKTFYVGAQTFIFLSVEAWLGTFCKYFYMAFQHLPPGLRVKIKRKGKWAQHSRRSYITIKGMLELCRCLLDHLTLAHKVGPPIPRTYQFCSTRLSKRTTHLAQSEGRGWVCLDVHSFYCLQVFLSKTLNWINYKTHQVPSQIHLHTIIR